MNITIKRTEQNIALLKRLGSKNKAEALEAQESLANFIGPVLQEVVNAAPSMAGLFTDMPFGENDNPSIPLDLYRDVEDTDYLRVWSQVEAGGMPYNMPTPPQHELKFSTYTLDSAWAFETKYAREGRLDVVSKTFERIMQEVLLKQDRNSAALLLRALAVATSKIKQNSTEIPHIIRSSTAGTLILDDFVRMFTLHKRIRSAWNDGTAESGRGRGLTDLVVSPEMVEELRRMAFNAVNTRSGVVTGSGGQTESSIPLHEKLREQIYENAGIPEFYGVNIIEVNELGQGYKYNDLFSAFAGSTNIPNNGEPLGSSNTTTFNSANEEILVGLDLTNNSNFLRPVVEDGETGSQFVVEPDDQFSRRAKKIGFYGSMEEGRLILDDKALSGLTV